MANRLTLRDRLRVLRRDALARLAKADQIDSGELRHVADTSAALAAFEAETMQAVVPMPGDRALVSDNNCQIQIVVYSVDRQAACATVSPTAAIRLGNQLIAAGVRRL